MTTDARIDAYIEKAQPFAQPILGHLRKLVHAASPHITETIKWGMPFFEYKGMLGSIAAFKQHCAFNLLKARLMKDAETFLKNNEEGMGLLGRITSLQDLPPDDVLIGYIREAMRLNDDDIKPVKKAASIKELIIPETVTAALAGNDRAKDMFDKFSYSNKKEYVEWIAEAKTDATRNKRVATMLEWLEEGKDRNWKYKNC